MKLYQKILLTVLAATCLVALGGCQAKPSYGEFNIGVCLNGGDFVESHVIVDAQNFTIVANAIGPDIVRKFDEPMVLKFVSEQDGVRKYEIKVNEHTDDVLVSLKDGILQGQFLINNNPTAKLHGHLGSLANVGPDGVDEYKNCEGPK